MVDWRAQNTPLQLPGMRQGVCVRTFFEPLSHDVAVKEPEVRYYATSLPCAQADAGRLADLIRGHWGVENRLHHVKDRTFHEDRHWLKNRAAANAMTFLRSITVSILNGLKIAGRPGRMHCPEKIEYMQGDWKRPLGLVCGRK